ncbi:MAG TPA: amidase [Caldimonas sp.]|nr:amidase [Caldimonas sp.]HEV7578159.1 amidase [Caldimonas sp.]
MADDLTEARRQLIARSASAAALVERSIAAAATPRAAPAFVATSFAAARAAAAAADRAVSAGRDPGPLAGLAVSIKDLFDVAGETTAAGSTILRDAPPAAQDAPAVARLRRAGAAFIGRTHMSEFAFSGVGLNLHWPTLANPATLDLDPTPRVPGGSTSGGAATVATGAAWAALGSDTGGSIRIPAALQGVVGFKGTARLVPIDGAVPLSTTLDTVSAMTRSVRDTVVLHEVLASRTVQVQRRALGAWRFAVPSKVMLDGLDETVQRAFQRSLATLSAAGARIERIELAPLAELASINANGSFPAAESWAYHRRWLAERESEYDPRVALRMRRGETMSAADYIDLVAARRDWIARMETALQDIDALLSPTVPMVAPPLAPLVGDDAAFFAANGLLLRNPSIINFLDGCALSMPCQRDDELPVGLMVWHGAGHDDAVLSAGLAIEAALAGTGTDRPRG